MSKAETTSPAVLNSALDDDTFCIPMNLEPGSDAEALEISNAVNLPTPFLGVYFAGKWENGRTLTVAFFGGSPTLQSKVQRYASEWMKYANLKFQFVPGRSGDIRIVFSGAGGGSWSYVGTGNSRISSWQHTMQLGVSDNSTDTQIRRVTLHEFGHAIGCIHEHSQPNANIRWDRQAVLDRHRGIWDANMVEHNIFRRYSSHEVRASSFDPHSIMLYPIPLSWTYGTFSSQWNDVLSSKDQEFIGVIYPFNSVSNPGRPAPPPGRPTPPPGRPTPPVVRPPSRPTVPVIVRPPVRPVTPHVITNGNYYHIINTTNNTFLHASNYNPRAVNGGQDNGGYLNQKWIAKKAGRNWIFQNARTGTYLSEPEEGRRNITVSTSQTEWSFTTRNANLNHYTLNLASNPSLVLDQDREDFLRVKFIVIALEDGGPSQVWEFVPTTRGTLP